MVAPEKRNCWFIFETNKKRKKKLRSGNLKENYYENEIGYICYCYNLWE